MPFIPDSGQSYVPYRRKIKIDLDSSSWPTGSTIPSGLVALAQTLQWASYPELFAHIAERTAPPTGYGFSLSETWAFLRYFSAVSHLADFALAPRWKDIDSHQKTILSDDWGMGFASLIATDVFQPVNIANTGEWLKKAHAIAYAKRPAKRRGPAKTPDFAIEDAAGQIHLVEAKGTQNGDAVDAQLAMGVQQKENVEFRQSALEGERIVVGTCIPLQGNGRLQIMVHDPEFDLGLPEDLNPARAWLRRVAFAGACRASGLPAWADALLDRQGFRGARAEEAALDLRVRGKRFSRGTAIVGRDTEILLPEPLEHETRGWRVTLGMPLSLLEGMLAAEDLNAYVLSLSPRDPRRALAPEDPEDDGVIDSERRDVVVRTPNSLHLALEPLG